MVGRFNFPNLDIFHMSLGILGFFLGYLNETVSLNLTVTRVKKCECITFK